MRYRSWSYRGIDNTTHALNFGNLRNIFNGKNKDVKHYIVDIPYINARILGLQLYKDFSIYLWDVMHVPQLLQPLLLSICVWYDVFAYIYLHILWVFVWRRKVKERTLNQKKNIIETIYVYIYIRILEYSNRGIMSPVNRINRKPITRVVWFVNEITNLMYQSG